MPTGVPNASAVKFGITVLEVNGKWWIPVAIERVQITQQLKDQCRMCVLLVPDVHSGLMLLTASELSH